MDNLYVVFHNWVGNLYKNEKLYPVKEDYTIQNEDEKSESIYLYFNTDGTLKKRWSREQGEIISK